MAKLKKDCLFCAEDPDGDLPERKDLLCWCLGRLADTPVTVYANIEQSFDGAANYLALRTSISDDANKKTNINFCPMCGRRLNL